MLNNRIIPYLTLVLTFFFTAHLSAQEKLIFAIDLIRHGDRTPVIEIPLSPYTWKEGLGELTQIGSKQTYQLGQALRKKYVDEYHLLPAHYQANALYVRSTDTSRTKASARSLLLGLYPLETRSKQNIPIHTIPKKQDHLLIVKPQSDIFSQGKLLWLSHKAWWEKTHHLKPELKRWRDATGLPIKNLEQLNLLADVLTIRQLHGIPLPSAITPQDVEIIQAIDDWTIAQYFNLKEITYPTGHTFLNTVNTYLQQAAIHPSPLKYVLYSGHDSSLMSVMKTLGVPLTKNPRYAACLNFSLYEVDQQYYVKINYNNKRVSVPLCNKDACTLKQFSEIARR